MKINFLSKSSDQGDFASRTAIVATIAAATVGISFVLWKLDASNNPVSGVDSPA